MGKCGLFGWGGVGWGLVRFFLFLMISILTINGGKERERGSFSLSSLNIIAPCTHPFSHRSFSPSHLIALFLSSHLIIIYDTSKTFFFIFYNFLWFSRYGKCAFAGWGGVEGGGGWVLF